MFVDIMILYAATILFSSFLLFLVQPIIAKQILPWFGGTAAVWTTCLVFFQVTLLAGYIYSDLSNRLLKPKVQSTVHIVLLVLSIASLPILAGVNWKPVGDEDPFWRIAGLLVMTVGLPYFTLSTTAPLIQSWFAKEHPDPQTAKRVYRFFALSNLGAILGLLAYPFGIEMWVSTRAQAMGWSIGYAVFALLCIGSAWRARSLKQDQAVVEDSLSSVHHYDAAPQLRSYVLWFVLAALASMMLLAVTNHITQNVASIPFLWVLPLTLYLITFVLCFEGRGGQGFYLRKYWLWPTLAVTVAMAWGLTSVKVTHDINVALLLYCVGLFLVCMFCHGELAASKPAAKYLTRFYLMLSLGGAVGGTFVGLIAPKIFDAFWELPLGLVSLAILSLILTRHYLFTIQSKPVLAIFPSATILSLGVILFFAYEYNESLKYETLATSRNFYGTLAVKQFGNAERDKDASRRLLHGTVIHGMQYTAAPYRQLGTSYYSESSGLGAAFAHIRHNGALRIGGVGMGVGTIARYAQSGDSVKFYEINPEVTAFAKEFFYYLTESAGKVEVVHGDGRLLLEREVPQRFDLLAVDAFSGDAVPVHLLTREALALYMKHVNEHGTVAFHVTNAHLRLAPVVERLAREAGYHAILIKDRSRDRPYTKFSDWVIVTRDEDLINDPEIIAKSANIELIAGLKPWTDDFSNVFKIFGSAGAF